MPRTPREVTTPTRRRRRSPAATSTAGVVGQIRQLVTVNETLKLENATLKAQNQQLLAQLLEIGSALGRLSGGTGRGRGQRDAQIHGLVEAKPKRTRRPITDSEVLARRNATLAKARAARAEKLAAARAGSESSRPAEE